MTWLVSSAGVKRGLNTSMIVDLSFVVWTMEFLHGVVKASLIFGLEYVLHCWVWGSWGLLVMVSGKGVV